MEGNSIPPHPPCHYKPMPGKNRAVCFTINNWNDETIRHLDSKEKEGKFKYICWGYETAPTTGTPHLQGYGVCDAPRKLLEWKELLGPGAHIIVAKGNATQNRSYCRKESEQRRDPSLFHEHGLVPVQGRRNDLEGVISATRKKRPISEIADEFPEQFIKYHRGICSLHSIFSAQEPRNFKTEVRVYVGQPGVGKSKIAIEEASFYGKYYLKVSDKWWDGYDGQPTVIFDDFYGNLPYHELLRVCDRYPLQVQVKGAYREFTSRLIIFTSNKPIEDWYKTKEGTPLDVTAFLRRVSSYCEILNTSYDCTFPWIVKGQRIDY